MSTSKIRIRKVELPDFDQIKELYFRYVSGDLIGHCGSRTFLSYLRELYDHEEGALFCACSPDNQIIGFNIGVINKRQFNRSWFLRNLVWLGPLLLAKFFFSARMQTFLLTRLKAKFDLSEKIGPSPTKLKQKVAMSLWLVVDEGFRVPGTDIASELITAFEQDLKSKGVMQIYGFTSQKNLPTVLIYLKNGWQIKQAGDRCTLAKTF